MKYTKEQLAHTKPRRDAVVYKMHGDVEHPNNAVLTKDDYERYHVKMDQYISALKGDLISKTFIFIGFSFSDPNLDYILSRVRVAYDGNQRRHYCFIKNISKGNQENQADYEYRKRKQELFVKDLKRFNIKTILVDQYDEITALLSLIEKQYRRKTIFISGAANDYGKWGESAILHFIHNLSSKLISSDYRIVSGFGLGIGSSVITGALEQIYMHPKRKVGERLLLRPFPQQFVGTSSRGELWGKYRKDMLSHSGMAIFLLGNKLEQNKVVLSNGMIQEYEIAKDLGVEVIPVGSTGFVAKDLWIKERGAVSADPSATDEYKKIFEQLGDENLTLEQLSEVILNAIANR